ncbi:MurR/RpiR family transcriptional regulator [Mumia zhuanghuii]|uniref:MurR/RpiR family transcriptional regulator n=2 Tax=Mumia TaxID=1546255 RepID=A0ABW1QQI3_9ACTN|nr:MULTISPECIES: SIS domain-containing protein [Mumia]KAA1420073.1 MurR/RpiR family transcriptional regulator [Mumia zhuanghuii]
MIDDTPARPQRRSAALLKRRLVDEQRKQLDAMLDWAQTDTTLEEMAAAIVGARRRFIIGATQSFAYASLLALDLSASLANVHLVDGTIIRPIDVLSDVRSSDVLVAFSLHRYRKYTIDIATTFRDAGGSLLVITDAPDAPLATLPGADVVLVPPSGLSFDESPTSMSLVIGLIASLTAASAKGSGRRSAQRDHLGEVLDLYVD